MRNDLVSLNPGKAVAQGAHAANQMVKHYSRYVGAIQDEQGQIDALNLLDQWETSADGFGTTITLSVSEQEMRSAVMVAKALGFHAGIMRDPTYPFEAQEEVAKILSTYGYSNGVAVIRPATATKPAIMVRPEDVCAYVFGDKDELYPVLGRFPLMA